MSVAQIKNNLWEIKKKKKEDNVLIKINKFLILLNIFYNWLVFKTFAPWFQGFSHPAFKWQSWLLLLIFSETLNHWMINAT